MQLFQNKIHLYSLLLTAVYAQAGSFDCRNLISQINSTEGFRAAIASYFANDSAKSNPKKWKRISKNGSKTGPVTRVFIHEDGTEVTLVYNPSHPTIVEITTADQVGAELRISKPEDLLDGALTKASTRVAYDENLLGVGAIVVVKENAQRTPNMEVIIPTLPPKGLSVYVGETIPLDGGFAAESGSRLTVLRGPHKLDGRVKVVRVRSEQNNLEGWVYFSDFRKFIEIETPVVVMKTVKPRKPQFPKNLHYDGYGPNNEVPKIGDIVWIPVHTNLLAPSNVGKITGFSQPGNRQFANIETLNGSNLTRVVDELLLMSEQSLREVAAHYGTQKIKVPWLHQWLLDTENISE